MESLPLSFYGMAHRVARRQGSTLSFGIITSCQKEINKAVILDNACHLNIFQLQHFGNGLL
jgi:hypothetical protein